MGEVSFDHRFCKKGRWRIATYFATKAKYSDSFAFVPSEGIKQLIIAKVLTGNTFYSEPNDSLKIPPIIAKNKTVRNLQFSDFRFDSIHGFSNNTKIYAIYDSNKSYPMYLLTYFTQL